MSIMHTTTTQRAIAYVLLVSQLLTSCRWNETILPSKKQELTTQQEQYRPQLELLDLNEAEDSTQDTSLAPILKDGLPASTLEQPIQPQQDLALIPHATDQPVYQGTKKGHSEQTPINNKNPLSLNPATFKPISTKNKQPKNLPDQSLPISTTPWEQPVTKPNQEKTFNPVTISSQETVDTTLAKPVVATPISYSPYTIKGGHQVQFIQDGGQWVALVKESLPTGISREPMMLPVYLELGLNMEEVSKHPHMDIIFPTKSNNGQGYVVCTRQAGLPGGMKEGDKCLYSEDEKVWDGGLGRWVCPGTGKHPRSENQPSVSEDKPTSTLQKDFIKTLESLTQNKGAQVQISKEAIMEERQKRNEEMLQHQAQEFFDRARRHEMEFLAQKEIEKRAEEENRLNRDIAYFRSNLVDKYKPENNVINLPDLKTIEAFQQDIIKAIYAIGEKIKELDNIEEKYEGKNRFKYYREPKEVVQPDGPFELWQLDTSESMELYNLYVKAEEGKQWFIFYEETIDKLQKEANEIDELSEKISTDEAGIKALEQVINKAKELQKHIDNAIHDIEWYGGWSHFKPTKHESDDSNDFRHPPMIMPKEVPVYDFLNIPPKNTIKKVGKHKPSREYKEMLASHLKNAQTELEAIIKSYTRRRDIIYPQLKKMGESLINQGIKVVQEQAATLFPYQVETYFVELRPKKGQKEITDKMFEEIFPSDETVCIEKYLEFMEVVVIGIEKGTKNRKVSTVKINMKSAGPVKLADIDRGNYASLVKKFNQELEPVASRLNQLIQEGKDPVATLEQARKAKEYIEEATEQLKKYETKQDKKPNLDHFSELEETIESRIQIEQYKIFLNNLNQEISREGARTNELMQQNASPTIIIQEAKRFKEKVEGMKKQVESFDYKRHQVVHNPEKVLRDLTGIIQQIDQIIKEQEEKLKGEKLLVNPTGKGIRNDSGGDGYYGASRRDKKGNPRLHEGLDFSTIVGQNIVAPLTGNVINRIGKDTQAPLVDIWPIRTYPEFDYLQVLYVDKPEGIQWEVSRYVEGGEIVGTAANLQDLGYSSSVGPHVHVQLWRKDNTRIDPTPFFFKKEK